MRTKKNVPSKYEAFTFKLSWKHLIKTQQSLLQTFFFFYLLTNTYLTPGSFSKSNACTSISGSISQLINIPESTVRYSPEKEDFYLFGFPAV